MKLISNLFKILKWLIGLPVEFGKEGVKTPVVDPLDQPLVWLTDEDALTTRQLNEGVAVFGSTGSGKTSGSGQTLAKAYLRAGWGGLVLCSKNDEKALWLQYLEETGRSKDAVVFNAENPWRFNFLDFEASQSDSGAGLVLNLAQLFQTVTETSRRNEGASNQDFWAKTLQELIKNTIALLTLAGKKLSVQSMLEVITSAPQSLEQMDSEYFQQTSLCYECITILEANNHQLPQKDVQIGLAYWTRRYPGLAEKTRSIIDVSFSAMADSFLRGHLGELFCTDTNITPDDTYLSGKVIIVDLSVHKYRELGVLSNVLWKYCFQRAMERRDVKNHPQNVLIWGDEYHLLYSSKDALFQSTARSLRVAVTVLSQNLSGFYSALGGENRKSEVDAFMGNLNTKVFHAQSEQRTQLWSSDMIGKHKAAKANINFGQQGQPSFGLSEMLEHQVLPIEFTTLRKGGPDNDFEVDAILFQSGRIFSNDKNHIRVTFNQETP